MKYKQPFKNIHPPPSPFVPISIHPPPSQRNPPPTPNPSHPISPSHHHIPPHPIHIKWREATWPPRGNPSGAGYLPTPLPLLLICHLEQREEEQRRP